MKHPCDMHDTWFCMKRRFELQLDQIWDEIKTDLLRAGIVATLACWFIAGVLFSWNQVANASVQQDAYPTATWHDYSRRVMETDSIPCYPVPDNGVITLWDDGRRHYYVPEGVERFTVHCYEGEGN